jgi:hypothetical protein
MGLRLLGCRLEKIGSFILGLLSYRYKMIYVLYIKSFKATVTKRAWFM